MTNLELREKVVHGLKCCCIDDEICPSCEECPYGPCSIRCSVNLYVDTLRLLDTHVPIEAIVCNNDISGAGSWWYQCGKCMMPIDPKDRFCRHCGKAAKWV